MTGADLPMRILKAEGVRQCFRFPNSPIIEAMARAGLRVITTRQERVAGNMPDGVSRSTNGREIGVFTVQALASAENAFAGIAQAHTDSTPVLFLPGHSGTARPSTAPPITARRRRWRGRCCRLRNFQERCTKLSRHCARAGRGR